MWRKQLFDKFLEGISHNGVGSEKRIIKMWVVGVLLALTIVDYFYEGIRVDVWGMWFGLIGLDGWRMSNEKKMLK